jgi:hypothetical protein
MEDYIVQTVRNSAENKVDGGKSLNSRTTADY